MAYEVGLAESEEEKEAVYRFRYSVYVEEMGRYQDTADHAGRRLVEPEDDTSFILYVRDADDGTVVGTGRMTWGGYGFSQRQIDEYSLAPFLDALPHECIAVGERVMVKPSLRGTGLIDDLMEQRNRTAQEHDVRIQFAACEPHLLSLYLGQGRRTYATKNINTPEAGYLIPLVAFPEGPDALRGVGEGTPVGELPACVAEILASGGAVMSPLMTSEDDYTQHLRSAMHEIEAQDISAFHAFTDEDVERCLGHSTVIECAAGDRVLKKGGVARNIFVVLDGTLEARDGDRVVGVIRNGEVFGEMAFLLERPRSVDVYAASDAVKVLSLSESTIRKMVADDPGVAAKLLFNISKMLCVRIVKAS
jgi:predicted GNAT family N-acyltransferase